MTELPQAPANITARASSASTPTPAAPASVTADEQLLAAVARVLAESEHRPAIGVRRIAAQLVHDLHTCLSAGQRDAARVAQTIATLLSVVRAWPATSVERLLVRAIAGRNGVSVGRTARKPRAAVAETA